LEHDMTRYAFMDTSGPGGARPRRVGRPAALGGVALTALVLLAGCSGGPAPQAGGDTLVIYSPHSDEIRQEFGEAFQAWYKGRTGRDVDVKWPDPSGGGTEVLRRLEDKFRAKRYDIDVAFGGGPIFEPMKQLGMLEPYKLPAEALAALPPKIAGQPVYDADFAWYGAAISTFGIIYNKTIIKQKNLPEVKDWESMADPRFFGLVGAGDPSKSATVLKAYEIILQAYGYDRGMALLARIAGNAREFYPTSSEIPRNTAKGFLAVGPCIDFYAYRQMRSEGGDQLGFVAPSGLTVITPDPIAILKRAPHRKVAEKFVDFVMGPEGQRLWMLPAGTPGGPKKVTLGRLAVLPATYEEAAAKGVVIPFNPLAAKSADFYDPAKENARQAILADYLRVVVVENHDAIKKAWKAIIEAGLPAERLAEFCRPIVAEDEMLRLGREGWTAVLIPGDAPADEQARLTREAEAHRRTKSDTLTRWSEAVRAKYAALAK
jgi:ABC-type Fe3+ transport system substrate-binding protein